MTHAPHLFTRRTLLRGAAGSAAAALLAACTPGETPTPAPTPLPTRGGVVNVSPAATVAAPPTAMAMAMATVAPTTAPTAPAMPPTMGAMGAIGATGAASAAPGSVAATLAATTASRSSAVVVMTPPPPLALPMGFAAATPAAMATAMMTPSMVMPGATAAPDAKPPADLMGRLGGRRLVFALPPGDANSLGAYADLLAYMTGAFGSEVVGVVGPTAAATVEAMRARVVDVAILAPFAYTFARREAAAVPLVAGEAGNGMPAVNSSVLFCLREGGPASPADLKGKTVAFVAADVTIGQVLPAYLLATNPRLVEGRDYTVLTVPTYADAYAAVTERRADAGVLSTAFFEAGLQTRGVDNDRVRVLDKSPEVPGNLVAARGDLPMPDQEAVAALLLTINEQPATSRLVQGTIALPPRGRGLFGETAVKLRRAADAPYDRVREIGMSFGVDPRALAR